MTRIVIDEAAIAALAHDPAVLAAVREQVAEPLAADMRASAPRRTGRGADSIHVEPDPDEPGFRVSWDKDHFYMSFQNDGTIHLRPRRFAENAAKRYGGR